MVQKKGAGFQLVTFLTVRSLKTFWRNIQFPQLRRQEASVGGGVLYLRGDIGSFSTESLTTQLTKASLLTFLTFRRGQILSFIYPVKL